MKIKNNKEIMLEILKESESYLVSTMGTTAIVGNKQCVAMLFGMLVNQLKRSFTVDELKKIIDSSEFLNILNK